ncbi:polysaccharide biosynthesis protein GumN [Aquibium carbonis]|uniref:Polysaccharide biosynthesis protein GumN n=1 Tax=Aquibium carbonis TaxID=2495581 RepID=A0A3S0AC81_9HYPH|nr:TraB/GumN family protein [Aquibium carbonis]RST88381.1 polysaccharide biosynthesis protein GumN [Aquibium carbonis]
MNRPPFSFDVAARLALRLLAAANVLLALGLLATLLLISQARAEVAACTGTDLLAQIEAEDPDTFARLRAEASAVSNGSNLLWKVEKPGVEPSWLFGTMHLTDPRVTDLPDAARSAYHGARTVVIETTDILDQAKMMAAMVERPDLMMYTDGTTLTSSLPADKVRIIEDALAARGVPPASVSKMKPWMLAAALAIPACETARQAAGLRILDVKLAQDARTDGKPVEGLETMIGQLEAMASLPLEFHIDGLIATLDLGDRMADIFETMVILYHREEIGMIWPLFRAVLPEEDASGYEAFETVMIDTRNETMRRNAMPFLDAGGAFIAVGALHLPGERGLVAMLRASGYAVSPMR